MYKFYLLSTASCITSLRIEVSPTMSFLVHCPCCANPKDLLILWMNSCLLSATPVLGSLIFMLDWSMFIKSPSSRCRVELLPDLGRPTKFIRPTHRSTHVCFCMASWQAFSISLSRCLFNTIRTYDMTLKRFSTNFSTYKQSN